MDELGVNFWTVVYAGKADCRGDENSAVALLEKFLWSGLTKDEHDFHCNCILNGLAKKGFLFLRALSVTSFTLQINVIQCCTLKNFH